MLTQYLRNEESFILILKNRINSYKSVNNEKKKFE